MTHEEKRFPAVVMGLGVNGLGIVRSLASKGVPLYGLYSDKTEMGRFSKYVHVEKIPKVSDDPEGARKIMKSLAERIGKKSFLIGESDLYLSFMSENRDFLKEFFFFNLSEKKLVEEVLDKNGNHELAERYGVLVPKTAYPQEDADFEAIAQGYSFPIIIKPLKTYSEGFPGNAKNIILTDRKELFSVVRENPGLLGTCVAQEVIIGNDGNIVICSMYFDKASKPLAAYTGRKIRQLKPDYGVTSCGVSEDIPEIRDETARFLTEMGYRGLATTEFAQDVHTGKFYFLEMNGRSYYHNSLFTDCNINLSYIAYRDAVYGQTPVCDERQKNGVVWLDFSRDASSFRLKRKAGKMTAAQWLKSILKARSFAVYCSSDIRPFLYSTIMMMKNATRSFSRRTRESLRSRLFNRKTGKT